MKAVTPGRWAYNQCDSICVLAGLLIDELLLMMALSQVWVPHTNQGLLLHVQAVRLFYQRSLQGRWNPIKPVLAHPTFSFLLYRLRMPGPESNNTLSPKIWRTRCQMRLEPHHPPCLSWSTCRAGIRRCWLPWSKGKFCRAYDGFAFLVRNHTVSRQPNLDIKNHLQGSCLGNRGPLFSFSIRDIFAWLKTKVHVWNANVKSPSTCSH